MARMLLLLAGTSLAILAGLLMNEAIRRVTGSAFSTEEALRITILAVLLGLLTARLLLRRRNGT